MKQNKVGSYMKIIGITGGIASGKSLVTKILKDKYHAYVINTDAIAREQMEPGGVSYLPVVAYFGEEILAKDRTIDRSKLSQIVFHDKEKLHRINQITHPLVLEEVERQLEELRKGGQTPYAVIETALMIESGYDKACDEVWYVFSPEETRRRRLMEERKLPKEKIEAILKNQSSEEAFRSRYQKVIENIKDIAYLEQQIQALLHT